MQIFGKRYDPQAEIQRVETALREIEGLVEWLRLPPAKHFKEAWFGQIQSLTQDVHNLALDAPKHIDEIKFKRQLAEVLGRIWGQLESRVEERARLQQELKDRIDAASETEGYY